MTKNKNIHVLMIGSSLSVKGGISSVIRQFLNHTWNKDIKISYIPTYIEGNILYKVIYYIKAIIKIIYFILLKRIDIVHIHMSHTGSFYRKYIIFKISRLLKKKVIIHLHGSEFKRFFDISNYVTKILIKDMLERSEKILVLGENWNKIIKEIEANAKTMILMNTVAIPEQKVIHDDYRINILFLGSLVIRKGIFELVEVVKNMRDKSILQNYNVKFTIGGTGKEEEHLRSKISSYKLEPYVNMVGWVDGECKNNLLKESQIFILPSHNEGLPVAILEAISYGIPVISTKVGSIDEAVHDKYNGLLIDPNNIKQMEEALMNIIESPNIWRKFSINSRQLAIDKFNQDKYFKDIEELYREIMR